MASTSSAAISDSTCPRFGLLLGEGSADSVITDEELAKLVLSVMPENRKKICVVPPDMTRFHSKAGVITNALCRHYGEAVTDVIPALGTHVPMTDEQLDTMYGEVPREKIR